jgi:3-oxoadipate enol-lactonase
MRQANFAAGAALSYARTPCTPRTELTHRSDAIMPDIQLSPGLTMHYEIDDFTDPWKPADTILMLHGNCESGKVWFGWVPHLARDYKVVRPDMRGYGQSTPVPRDYPWTIDVVIDDFIQLMDALKIERFHLVGAKIAGFIARRFAARFPDRIITLTVIGTPPPVYDVAARVESLTAEIEQSGIEGWARRSMAGRLGSGFPAEGVEWWWSKPTRRQSTKTKHVFAGLIDTWEGNFSTPSTAR